jgi:2-dehydropantoate 2-reductase
MRIAIVGAGAIGCSLAGPLSARGHEVTLVGRPAQVEAIERDGLALEDPSGARRIFRLDAATALATRPDLVLLTVKTQDVAAACAALLPLAAGVPVVALQNGVRGDQFAADVLGREAVLGAVVMSAASYLRPGEVTVQFPGWLIVGEPFGPVRVRTREVARVLRGALPTHMTRHLDRVRWSKLISNLNNGLCAATGLALPELMRQPEGPRLALRVMREGRVVTRAAGIRLDHGLYGLTPHALLRDPTAALIALLQASMTSVLTALPERVALAILRAAGRGRLSQLPIRGSTWQSIARGRPSELDYLNGEIVRLGRARNIPTPYNTHLAAVVRGVEATRQFVALEVLLPPAAAGLRAQHVAAEA